MSHKQKHRGQHANDPNLFQEKWISVLNDAVDELSYLLSRGYSDRSSLKLVGDRHLLHRRQRQAVLRASCSDEARSFRQAHAIDATAMRGKHLAIDAYNLLITIEVGLSKGILIKCRDGCFRDIASIHGTYRRVEETLPALKYIGDTLIELEVGSVTWFLDAPISNSGRLKILMHELAAEHQFSWNVNLVNNPDRNIVDAQEWITVSSDGWVLDRSDQWFNLSDLVISKMEEANIISLKGNTVD